MKTPSTTSSNNSALNPEMPAEQPRGPVGPRKAGSNVAAANASEDITPKLWHEDDRCYFAVFIACFVVLLICRIFERDNELAGLWTYFAIIAALVEDATLVLHAVFCIKCAEGLLIVTPLAIKGVLAILHIGFLVAYWGEESPLPNLFLLWLVWCAGLDTLLCAMMPSLLAVCMKERCDAARSSV